MTKKQVGRGFNPGHKPEIAMDKHKRVFAGTPFEKCALCPGCAAAMNADSTMNCSRAGAAPVAVTPEQARNCEGKNPLLIFPAQQTHPKHGVPSPVFRKPAMTYGSQRPNA